MKIISKISLIIIFISLIGYIQPVDANHFNTLLGYHDEIYKIHLQTIIRDKDNQLVSVIESTATNRLPTYLPDGVPVPQLIDAMIDLELMKNHQIVIIDDKKYEKVQWVLETSANVWLDQGMETPADSYLELCADFKGYGYTCVPSFEAMTAQYFLERDFVVTDQWTVLRIIS